MSKKANLFISESGRAKQPDLSVPAVGAIRHVPAAKHFAEAARHQRLAAKDFQSGHPEKAGDRAQLTRADRLQMSSKPRKRARIT